MEQNIVGNTRTSTHIMNVRQAMFPIAIHGEPPEQDDVNRFYSPFVNFAERMDVWPGDKGRGWPSQLKYRTDSKKPFDSMTQVLTLGKERQAHYSALESFSDLQHIEVLSAGFPCVLALAC